MRSFLLAALIIFPAFAFAEPEPSVLVTASVGEVNGNVVTLREVKAATFIERVMQKEVLKANALTAVYGSPNFQKELSQVLLDYVVYLEAENFAVAQVAPTEVQRQTQEVIKVLGHIAEWKKLEMQKTEVETLVARKLRAKQFLKFKTETSGVNITEEEVKNYFDKNRVRFGNVTYDSFKSNIREFLVQQALQERLKDWFEVLKRKYRVRFLKVAN